MRPDIGFGFVHRILHLGLLFAPCATDFAADECYRCQPRSLTQPAGEDDAFSQLPGFPRQNHEDGMCNFLSLMRIARVAHGDRIDLVDVPLDECGKSLLGIAFDVFPQQDDVIQFLHLSGNAADAGKVTSFFRETRPLNPASLGGCTESGCCIVKDEANDRATFGQRDVRSAYSTAGVNTGLRILLPALSCPVRTRRLGPRSSLAESLPLLPTHIKNPRPRPLFLPVR